jgi:hypothetical protein
MRAKLETFTVYGTQKLSRTLPFENVRENVTIELSKQKL